MAATIDTTIGGSAANSYVTLQEASDFLTSRRNHTAWLDANDDERAEALIEAADRFNEEKNWTGYQVTTTQRLAWPRASARKPESIGHSHFYAYCYSEYLTTEIPQAVKDAQCKLALAYLNGFNEDADQIESYSSDGLSVRKKLARPQGGLPAEVLRLLSGLIEAPRLVRE